MDKTKKDRKIPSKYTEGLSKEDKKKQIKSIKEQTIRPKLKSAKSRRSKWTILFDKEYGDRLDKMKGKRSKKNIAKITGIPFKAIDEVYKKAEGAYFSSGSRANQSPQSWARGRIYGYIMGNPKVRKVDKAITEKYNVKFKH
jgi:hypothetical protein